MKVIGNRYLIEALVGKGGMGEVYRAFDRLTNGIVALKSVTYFTSKFADEADVAGYEQRLSLTREFKTLSSLRHPQIISVLDYGFDEQRKPFFTMEFLEDAQTFYQGSVKYSLDEKITALIQVLQALAYLHRRGVLHRDLKPQNILISHYKLKVLDFGLSITHDQARENAEMVSGTLLYMAPEVITGNPHSIEADFYAIGVIIYEILCGRPPFEGNSLAQLMNNILTEAPDMEKLADFPQLAAVVSRLLSKTREDRYHSASELIEALCEATQTDIPPETLEIRESFLQAASFVGRLKEFNLLTQALEESMASKGKAWLIGGESGIGKSRLVDELRTHSLVRGALVFRGQAIREGGMPYHIWRGILRELLLTIKISPTEQAIMKMLFPDLDSLLGEKKPETEPELSQQALLGAILGIFQRQDRPMLIILEDLHWAGEESLALLRNLISVIAERPVLLVADFRDDEHPQLPDQLEEMHFLKLERLNRQSITELSTSMLGDVGRRNDILGLLEKETEGNVFFIVEVIRALAEQTGRLDEIGSMTLPEQVFAGGIQQIIENRLTSIPPEAAYFLEIAAIVGRQIDFELISAVDPSLNLNALVNMCSDVSILELIDGEWRFSHDKLREGIYMKIEPARKIELHEKVALLIEKQHEGQAEEHASRLVFHWARANNVPKERYYTWIAGQQAWNLNSFRDAKELLQNAVKLYADSETLEEKRVLAQANLLLGDTYVNLGSPQQGEEYLEIGLAISREIGDLQLISETLRNLGIADFRLGNYASARQKLEESVEISRQLKRQTDIATAVYFLGAVDTFEDKLADAEAHIREALNIRLELNDQWGIARAYNGLGEVALTRGHYEEADQNYNKALEIFKTMKDQWWICATLNNLGHSALYLGRYEESLQRFKDAINTSYSIGAEPILLKALAGVAHLQIINGNQRLGAELAYFILNHPSADGDGKFKAEQALKKLVDPLRDAILQKAKQEGENLTLDRILSEVLRKL